MGKHTHTMQGEMINISQNALLEDRSGSGQRATTNVLIHHRHQPESVGRCVYVILPQLTRESISVKAPYRAHETACQRAITKLFPCTRASVIEPQQSRGLPEQITYSPSKMSNQSSQGIITTIFCEFHLRLRNIGLYLTHASWTNHVDKVISSV